MDLLSRHNLNYATTKEDRVAVASGSTCMDLARKYKDEAIDLAGIDPKGKLTILKGKSFVYSSKSTALIKEIEIDKSCGRTILCDVHVDRVKVKKGHLHRIRSTVKQEIEHEGSPRG